MQAVTKQYKIYFAPILCFFMLFFSLPSCTTSEKSEFDIGFLEKTFGSKIEVTLQVEEGANNNSSILVEYVQIYKNEIFDKIKKYNVGDWFLIKDEITEIRNSSDLNILNWQLVPENSLQKYIVKVNNNVVTALLFVRYFNDLTAMPIKLHPFKDVSINFDKIKFEFAQEKTR